MPLEDDVEVKAEDKKEEEAKEVLSLAVKRMDNGFVATLYYGTTKKELVFKNKEELIEKISEEL